MSYTGYQDITPQPRKPRLPTMLRQFDIGINDLGLKISSAELDQARQYQASADSLRAAFAERVATARELVQSAAGDYVAGTVSEADLIEQAATSATLLGSPGQEARRLIEAAAETVEDQGAKILHALAEERWIKTIRPAVQRALKDAASIADEIGINEPSRQLANTRTSQHPWAPAQHDLDKDMALRHKWERLGAALDNLDEIYSYADQLRRWTLLPTVEGRTTADDYRWKRIDLLNGRPANVREFYLENRHTGEPGLFTTAELEKAQEPAR